MADHMAPWVLIGLLYGMVLTVFISVKLDTQKRRAVFWEHGCSNHMNEETVETLPRVNMINTLYPGTYITSPGCLYRLQLPCNHGRITVITTEKIVYQVSQIGLGAHDYLTLSHSADNVWRSVLQLFVERNDLVEGPHYPSDVTWTRERIGVVMPCIDKYYFRMAMSDDGVVGCDIGDERMVRLWQNGEEVQLGPLMRQQMRQPSTAHLTPCTNTWCICSACKISDLGNIDLPTLNVTNEAHLLQGYFVKHAGVEYYCSHNLNKRMERFCNRISDDINSLGQWLPIEEPC